MLAWQSEGQSHRTPLDSADSVTGQLLLATMGERPGIGADKCTDLERARFLEGKARAEPRFSVRDPARQEPRPDLPIAAKNPVRNQHRRIGHQGVCR